MYYPKEKGCDHGPECLTDPPCAISASPRINGVDSDGGIMGAHGSAVPITVAGEGWIAPAAGHRLFDGISGRLRIRRVERIRDRY